MINKGGDLLDLHLDQQTYTTTINAGATGIINVIPPEGEIWELIGYNIYVTAPGATSSGTNDFAIETEPMLGGFYSIIILKSVHGSDLRLSHSYILADSSKQPTNNTEIWEILKGFTINTTNYMKLTYTNNTDANNTNNVQCNTLWKVYRSEK